MVKRRAKKQVAVKQPEQYAVIQPTLRCGNRTWFESEADAYEEAHALLQGRKVYPNYRPPPCMVIVRVVGIVEATLNTRAKRGKLVP